MYTNDIKELISLRGDFGMLIGAPASTPEGFAYNNGKVDVRFNITRHASGVISRRDTVTNVSGKTLSITAALSRFSFDNGEWEVYTQYDEWCNESLGRWVPLTTGIDASNYDARVCSGATPFLAIFSKQTGRGYAFHLLPNSMWQMRVFREFRQSHGRRTIVELGISERGFCMELSDGESLTLPEILYYEFKSQSDFDAYKLHRYLNERFPEKNIPVIYNTWMSHEDRFTYADIREQLDIAALMGVEYFVIDAGWFGIPTKWWSSVGDWEEHPEAGFGGRMKEFCDEVRAKGLKVGLWFEIERAGSLSKTLVSHPEHYLKEGEHGFVDFASPEARDYVFKKLSAIVDKYGIEYLKFDFNASMTYDARCHSFLDYFAGRQIFFDRVKECYPEIYIEMCSSGGAEMCIASLSRHINSFWMSDDHSLYSQMRIYKDSMVRMPCRSLETWLTIRSVENFREIPGNEKILASGDCSWIHVEAVNRGWLEGVSFGGPLCISCDITKLSADTVAQLTALIKKHKSECAFISDTECRILSDTETLTALQWNDRGFGRLRITAFTSVHNQSAITLYPIADVNKTYRDTDGNTYTGMDLSEYGVTVTLGGRYESYTKEFEVID